MKFNKNLPPKIKYIILFIGALFLGASYVLSHKYFNSSFLNNEAEAQVEIEENILALESPFKDLDKPIYGIPKTLLFDSFDLKIEIIKVGVSEDGSLEAPEDWNTAGWYHRSARPSENGNVIINAHYDDNYGRPAAFWKLKNISIDDKVSVIDSFGRFHDYHVSEKFYVEMNDPNRLDVVDLESNEGSELTLITCSGVYYPAQGYNKRLVVKAELIQD